MQELVRSGRLDEAVDLLCARLDADPGDRAARTALATVADLALRRRRTATAEVAAERLTVLAPQDPEAWSRLCAAREQWGRRDDMVDTLRSWLEHCPSDERAAAALHRILGEWSHRAPEDTVRRLFDDYAETFDVHLAELGYRAPALVVDALRAIVGASPVRRLADLGCGTGLVGERIRSGLGRPVQEMIGVDLSPAMLAKAATKRCYDELVADDLLRFLGRHPGRFDVIVSADTLNYLGELRPTLAAAHAALVPGGCFVFTLERALPTSAHAYRPTESGRFQHRADRVADHLVDSGFERCEHTEVVLRSEGTRAVGGLLFAARRPGAIGARSR